MGLRLRTSWLAVGLLVLLAGCVPRRPLIPVPPEIVEGGWTRVGLETPPLDQAPEALRAARPAQWVRTSYKRVGYTVLVDAYGMPNDAVAFEAMQHWRNEPGVLAFRKGNLFIVCSSATEPTDGLIEFSRRLEKAWLGGAK